MITTNEEIINYIKKSFGIDLTLSDDFIVQKKIKAILDLNTQLLPVNIYLNSINNNPILFEIIKEIITIHETSFFRDKVPFDFLANYFKSNKVEKIMVIPSSFGQEPYSIAMLLEEYKSFGTKVDAYDISRKCIEYSKQGEYNEFEVGRGISTEFVTKYFDISDKKYLLKNKIKKYVNFNVSNIVKDDYEINFFDIIFCRNLLIYFSQDTRNLVVEKLKSSLKNNGILILGSSEYIKTDGFSQQRDGNFYYYKKIK